MKTFFVFDVESVGLHGEGFAVAGGVYLENGAVQYEFGFSCPPDAAKGTDSDREWVNKNIPVLEVTHRLPIQIRDAFWAEWSRAKKSYPDIVMAAECAWPVEARFLCACVDDLPTERNWTGPYPMHDIASLLLAAGFDPMAKFPRTASELPEHNPLTDARQSARLLSQALYGKK